MYFLINGCLSRAAAINLVGACVCTPHINVTDLFLIKLRMGGRAKAKETGGLKNVDHTSKKSIKID